MSTLGKSEIVGLLEEHGAILSGHFQLPTGLHTQTYIQTALVLQYPHLANKLAKSIAAKFPNDIDVVVSPAMGAVVIGQEVARVKKARAIFTERASGAMSLKREFKLERGERVLVVEDVLNTGRSIGEIVNLARAYGAKVLGVAAIVDRSISSLPLTVPARALVSYPLEVFAPNNCPLCAEGIPITATPGNK